MVFSWQPNIGLYYDAMTLLNNLDTNLATIKVNMLAQDSFVVTAQLLTYRLYICAASPHLVTAVRSEQSGFVAESHLAQNYPNPFNPRTTISFTLPEEALITVKVYNALGQEVRALVRKQLFSQGDHRMEFEAGNLPSGVYYYRVVAQDPKTGRVKFASVKKMVLSK